MADTININGENVPMWMTDKTAKELLKAIKGLSKVFKPGKGGSDGKSLSAFEEAIRRATKGVYAADDALSEMEKNAKKVSKAEAAHAKVMATATGYLQKLPGGIGAILTGALNFVSGLGAAGKMISGILGGVVAALGYLITQLFESVDTLREFLRSGIDLGAQGGSLNIAAGIRAAGIRFKEFAAVMGKYTAVIGRTGIEQFKNLTVYLKKNVISLNKMAMYGDEAAEFLGSYLEQQRMNVLLDRMSTAEREKGSANYLLSLQRFSKLMNISMKDINENVNKMLGSDEFLTMIQALPEEQRKMVTENARLINTAFGALGPQGQQLSAWFTDMIASPVAESSASFQDLAKVSPQAAQYIAELSRKAKDGSISQADVVQSLKGLGGILGKSAVQLQTLGTVGGDKTALKLGALNATIQSAMPNINNLGKIPGDAAANSIVVFMEAIEKLKGAFIDLLLKVFGGPEGLIDFGTKMINLLGEGLKWLSNLIDNIKGGKVSVSEMIGDAISTGIDTMILGIVTSIVKLPYLIASALGGRWLGEKIGQLLPIDDGRSSYFYDGKTGTGGPALPSTKQSTPVKSPAEQKTEERKNKKPETTVSPAVSTVNTSSKEKDILLALHEEIQKSNNKLDEMKDHLATMSANT